MAYSSELTGPLAVYEGKLLYRFDSGGGLRPVLGICLIKLGFPKDKVTVNADTIIAATAGLRFGSDKFSFVPTLYIAGTGVMPVFSFHWFI